MADLQGFIALEMGAVAEPGECPAQGQLRLGWMGREAEVPAGTEFRATFGEDLEAKIRSCSGRAFTWMEGRSRIYDR